MVGQTRENHSSSNLMTWGHRWECKTHTSTKDNRSYLNISGTPGLAFSHASSSTKGNSRRGSPLLGGLIFFLSCRGEDVKLNSNVTLMLRIQMLEKLKVVSWSATFPRNQRKIFGQQLDGLQCVWREKETLILCGRCEFQKKNTYV